MNFGKAPSSDALKTLETAPALFLVLSPDFTILTASNLLLLEINMQREAVVGRYLFDAFPNNPEQSGMGGADQVLSSLELVIRTKKAHQMPIQRYDVLDVNHSGKFVMRYWEPMYTPIFDDDGEISYIIQSLKNVTALILSNIAAVHSQEENQANLKQVDALSKDLAFAHQNLLVLNASLEADILKRTGELMASEKKYRDLIKYSPVAMQVFRGEEMVFDVVNDAMLRFLGKTTDIIGKPLFVGVPEIVGQPIVEALYGVFHTGSPLEIYAEEVFLERNGKKEAGYYDVIYRALYDGEKISGILGIAIDVTPQIKAQKAIVESEARFRTMAEGSDIFISLIDGNGKLEYLNATWIKLTGWPQENIQDFAWQDFIHPDDLELVRTSVVQGLQNRQPFLVEFRLLNVEGDYRWLRVRGTLRFDDEHHFTGYICSGTDVTEERQRILEIEYINKALVKANDQLLETNQRLLESEDNLRTAFDAGGLGSCSLNIKTGRVEMSARYRLHYGLPLFDEISWEMVLRAVEPEFLDEVNLVLDNAVNFGSPVDISYAIRHLITGERKWMRVVGKVYQDAEGLNERIYAVVMDVTAEKADDQRKNDFIAMVSHELKTPLTSISGYTQLLQLKTKDNLASNEHIFIDKIQAQLKKMTTMINGFLNVSRLESGKIQVTRSKFDLAVLIKDSKEEYEVLASSHQISYSLTNEMWVHADRDKISHVITNLLSNAVKYSPVNSHIEVKGEIIDHQAIFSIRDQGNGIAAGDIPNLFDRYYRVQNEKTNSVSGFGIGLYLSAEIIERHGGKIWVESEVGSGSMFLFSLPEVNY